MTFLDLTALHYLKDQKKLKFDIDDLTSLMYVVIAIRRQPKRIWEILQSDSKVIMTNVQKLSKKYKHLRKLLFDVKEKYTFTDLEMLAFTCWYSFNHIDFKSFERNTLEKITDLTINQFRDWYKALNMNVHILYGFKKSCKTIMKLRKRNGESGVDCLNRLIEQDKISEVYYTGGITPYFLAAIPEKQIHIPKSAIFSNKLFSLVNENKEILISRLNYASKNYLKVPVNSMEYLAALQHVKN